MTARKTAAAPAKKAPAKKAAASKPRAPRKPTPPAIDPAVLEAAENVVLDLRRAGVDFATIASRNDLWADAGEARLAYDRALKRQGIDSTPEEVRELEVDRLDRLQAAIWGKAVKGDLPALDRILKISEQRDKFRALTRPNDGALRTAFDESVAASTAVDTAVDSALIAAGRKIADRIDAATANGEGQEVTKALYLLPHLNNILREMLATPLSRKDIGGGKPEGGALGKLRLMPGGKDAGNAAG